MQEPIEKSAVGPKLEHAERMTLLRTELVGLVKRCAELDEWVLHNIMDSTWQSKLTDLHIMRGRVDTIRLRIENLNEHRPELGEPIDTVTPNIPIP
jgi:hypothetical protein